MAIVLMECLWVICILLTLTQLIPTLALGVTLTMEMAFHFAMQSRTDFFHLQFFPPAFKIA